MTDKSDTLARLAAAGAPEIAEPHFYRVAFTEAGDLSVELRERRKLFGSDRIARRTVTPNAAAPADTLGAVVEALRDMVGAAERARTIHALLGDHAAPAVTA